MTTTAHETLIERVRELAAARAQAAASATIVRVSREAYEATIADHVAQAKADAERVAQMETALRAVAAEVYAETKDAKPAPGVTVKEYVTLHYDEGAALQWARAAGVAVIPEQLDKKAFEKMAKAAAGGIAGSYVIVEPRVQIATDLDKALAAGGDQ